MSLPGCEWDLIERYEKLCGVVLQNEKSTAQFLHRIMQEVRLPIVCYTLQHMQNYIFGHNLPKTLFKGVI